MPAGIPIMIVMILLALCAGCMSTTVGDAGYDNNSVMVHVTHSGEPADVTMQVTIYRIANLTQEKFTVASVPVTLRNGENTVVAPVRLGPGNYKLYVYILGDGDRKTAVIRDIVV